MLESSTSNLSIMLSCFSFISNVLYFIKCPNNSTISTPTTPNVTKNFHPYLVEYCYISSQMRISANIGVLLGSPCRQDIHSGQNDSWSTASEVQEFQQGQRLFCHLDQFSYPVGDLHDERNIRTKEHKKWRDCKRPVNDLHEATPCSPPLE